MRGVNVRHTSFPTPLVPLQKDIDVVEELRNDKVGSGFLLFKQVVDVCLLVGRVGVTFRVA